MNDGIHISKMVTGLLLIALATALSYGQGSEAAYYSIDTFPTEKPPMEVSAMTLLRDGRLMIATRLGDIFLLEGASGDPRKAVFKRWARGLAQPLGLLEYKGWIYTAQRGELTRMKDEDKDGLCDVFETVCDGWEISGNYHEYCFGPRLGPDGHLWVTTNRPFGTGPYGPAHWRGWALSIDPGTGTMTPVCTGLRSPSGIETSPWGDVFYTDNQGEWCNASKLSLLEYGRFYGHPWGLNTKTLAGKPFSEIPTPVSGTYMKDLHYQIPRFKMPAVWFPYEKMGQSPTGLKWDPSQGAFGPFAGQLFVGDQHHSWIMRVMLEKVSGHWQGACTLFRKGFQCGIIRLCFGKDHSLFVGESNAGWGSLGNKPWGLQRVRWTGKTPFEIQNMRALPDGFELVFTKPVARAMATDLSHYQMDSYTYKLESRYGGPEADKKQDLGLAIVGISPDGTRVRLRVKGLRAGYVHELRLAHFTAKDGSELLHPEIYYTLVNVPREVSL